MNKNVYIRTVLYVLLIIMCLYPPSLQAKPDNKLKISVGKKEPFTKLPEKKNEFLTSRETSVVSDIEDTPELFVEAVTLKRLDAGSLITAIENLSSEYGRISVDEKTNSLIICDTKEYLERILDQVRGADKTAIPKHVTIQKKTIPKLVAERITPKFLDARNLKTAIESMCSELGSISVVDKSNSLIVCDIRENIERILAVIKKIDKPTPGLLVETVTLKFLEAKNLKKAIDKMSSQYGSIATDDATNSLIICDIKDKLQEILAEISKADRTPAQIMVEVVIIDVQLDNDTEIGVNWDRLFETNRDEAYSQTLIPTTLTTGASFSVIKSGISGTIRALQKTRHVEILASPRVLVVSGQEAFIKTTEEIPYIELTQSSGAGGTSDLALTSTKFKEVGISLKVKATLIDDRKILMAIEPEQSINTGVVGVGDTTVPIVDKRSAGTVLLMEDGEVVVMGGLRSKETRITKNKVPLLGDLPLVGFLFSNNKKEIHHSELIVLISPHIQRDQPVSEDVMKKFNELKDRPMLSLPKINHMDNELISSLNIKK